MLPRIITFLLRPFFFGSFLLPRGTRTRSRWAGSAVALRGGAGLACHTRTHYMCLSYTRAAELTEEAGVMRVLMIGTGGKLLEAV